MPKAELKKENSWSVKNNFKVGQQFDIDYCVFDDMVAIYWEHMEILRVKDVSFRKYFKVFKDR